MDRGFERALLEGDHDEYELTLLPRLGRVVEQLLSVLRAGPARERLVRAWDLVGGIPTSALLGASHQPELDAWVKAAERVLGLGIARAYPAARPALLVHALELLVVSWARALPEGATSMFRAHGLSRIPLDFGATVLLSDPRAVVREV